MHGFSRGAFAVLFVSLVVGACGQGHPEGQRAAEAVPGPAPATEPALPQPAATTTPTPGRALSGKVVETMDAGGYTYALLETPEAKAWTAGPQTALTVGQAVTAVGAGLLKNFTSKTLGRTFPEIYFVSSYAPAGAATPPGAHPPVPTAPTDVKGAPPAARVSGIRPAEGGFTVAGLYEKGRALAGKPATVRGKVVKVTNGVLGKNWVHLQDGSGAAPNDDLVVTTGDAVTVGDVVLARGTIAANKDLGHGYKYELLLEDATLTKE